SAGGTLSALAPQTIDALNHVLPAHWSRGNPIDILGDADPERFAQALAIAARDPGTNGMLVMLTPTAMANPTQTAERIRPYAQVDGKPLLASWMGGTRIAAGEAILNSAGIPTFRYADAAARAFHDMWRYSARLRDLYETPMLPDDADALPDRTIAGIILNAAREAGRTLLTEVESKRLLAAYSIPTVETYTATSADAAVVMAERIGYPV